MDKNESNQSITEQDIKDAFKNDWFTVFFQPQVSLVNQNKIHGFETFVRMKHPKFGVLGPKSILPIINKMDSVLDLTYEIVKHAAKGWCDLKNDGLEVSIAINIDYSLLLNPGFSPMLAQVLNKYDVPASFITLELCQFYGEDIGDDIKMAMNALRIKGFSLALNDFIDAENVIQTIKNIPIDELKVGRSVIREIGSQVVAQTTLRRALYLAHQYGLRLVSVGIEHRAEADWLCKQGCDRGQGFLFGEPMELERLKPFLLNEPKNEVSAPGKKLRLMIVEDDEQYARMLADSLEDVYDVVATKTIEEATEKFVKHEPNLIIFDVHLPDGSGIELCRRLRQEEGVDFSAVFVSGSDDPVLKLDAYEAGAIDYLIKPCPFGELVAKMGRVAAFHRKQKELQGTTEEAQKAVIDSLKEASYYGDIVQFFKNILYCRDEQQLAQEIFSFMEKKDHFCSVQFRNSDSINCFCQGESSSSPIEINVFELLQSKGRVFEFGERTIFNDNLVSILIKNMPVEEEARGRVRDYIAVVIEGVETRYHDILRHRVLNKVLQQLNTLTVDLAAAIQSDLHTSTSLVEKFSVELGMSFHVLGLTIEQEEHITKLIERMLSEKDQSEISTDDVHERVTELVSTINQTVSSLGDSSGSAQRKESNDTIEIF